MVAFGEGTVARTPTAGIALVNGTPTLMTYNVPNDGKNHSIKINAELAVGGVGETGGGVGIGFTLADGTVVAPTTQLFAGNFALNTQNQNNITKLCAPGTTYTVVQTALTAGGPATFFGVIEDAA